MNLTYFITGLAETGSAGILIIGPENKLIELL
jgi:hypothetical protein